ncbi:MAG TPA: type II toxin-antitoxin system VapC family toxin [Firmicutes bacterium]|nr:type II toxin-antitoxin system VapC family toxin [Bacillota bacterium]
MRRILVDSDVLIGVLRNNERAITLLDTLSEDSLVACSALTVLEIQLGVRKGEEEKTNQLLDTLNVIALGEAEANLAGKIIRENRWKGITVDFADAGIAATCLLHGYELLTFNIRHFQQLGVPLLS